MNASGTDPAAASAGGWRERGFLLLGLTIIAGLYGWWSWGEGMGQPFADGPSYLMQAQHYVVGDRADPVYAELSTYSRFPPLYPLLLAASGGTDSLPLAHLATTACLILALAVFYTWLRHERLALELAGLLTTGVAALPGSWLAALSIQSEFPYLLLSLVALLLLHRYQREGRRDWLLAAALAVGAAMLTRAVGITLLPPLLLALWRAPRSTALAVLMLAALPPLAWHLVHHAGAGYGDSLAIYSGNLNGRLRHQLAVELPALRLGFFASFMRFPALQWPADILGLLCLAALLRRATSLRLDAVYLLAYAAVLLVWPYPEESPRLVWVVMPLLLAQPFLWLTGQPWRRQPSPALLVGCAGVLLAMCVPGLLLACARYRAAAASDVPQAGSDVAWYGLDPVGAREETQMHYIFTNAMRALPEYVPAGNCVLAIRPELVSYYGRREGRFPPLNSLPDPLFGEAVRRTGCHYALGVSGKDPRFPVPLHPLQRLRGATPLFKSVLHAESRQEDVLIAMLVQLQPEP